MDDEPQILDGLADLIDWAEHGIEIAGKVRNGEEALEFLRQTKVSMLLTDIRMPKMDGLELIRQIRQMNPGIRCMILSGYDDFEYVKEAIRLGIENYLLKPVNKEELSTTLINVISKIESELYRNINERQGLDIFRENLLQRWLSNSISESELLEKAEMVGLSFDLSYYTCAIIKSLSSIRPMDDNQSAGLTSFAIRNICSELFVKAEVNFLSFVDTHSDVVFIFPGSSPLEDAVKIKNLLKNCVGYINKYLKLDVFISAGGPVKGHESAHLGYFAAKSLQSYSLILPKNSIIDQQSLEQSALDREEKIELDFKKFRYLLEKKMYEECIRFIDDSLNKLYSIKGVTPVFVRNVTVELLFNISSVLKDWAGGRKNINERLNLDFSQIYGLNTLEELSQWLKDIIKEAIMLMKSENDIYTPLIRQVLGYIHQNYNKDISIKLLSSQFNINAAYLGQLFKNETGEMLTNYLNNIRVEKAKDMLLNTNLKTAEISEKVGYPNTNYFYRIFKKITGISPSEFR